MRYFVPEITLPPKPIGAFSRLFGGQPKPDTPREQLGGVPIGLPSSAWPLCRECGKSQSLLATFFHHPKRLDLGREGRRLMVFQCDHDAGMCETWSSTSGANACIVIEPEDLSVGKTPLPKDAPPIEHEVIILGWHEREDDISTDEAKAFFQDKSFLALGQNVWRKMPTSTHLGGVPHWIQSADEAPSGYRFLGQLDSGYSFLTPPRDPPSWVAPDPEKFEGRSHFAVGPNFGDGGIAYLFARDRENDLPEVLMFWQCG